MDICIFFFKQKTAYEMRISDWSSDVCSSDLRPVERHRGGDGVEVDEQCDGESDESRLRALVRIAIERGRQRGAQEQDRKSVVSGKSVSVRVDLGGLRFIKQKTIQKLYDNLYD